MRKNKIKEIFDPKLGARITHSQKILISDYRSQITYLRSQITCLKCQITCHISQISDHQYWSQISDLKLHKSCENLMMLRSLEKACKPLPLQKPEKEHDFATMKSYPIRFSSKSIGKRMLSNHIPFCILRACASPRAKNPNLKEIKICIFLEIYDKIMPGVVMWLLMYWTQNLL